MTRVGVSTHLIRQLLQLLRRLLLEPTRLLLMQRTMPRPHRAVETGIIWLYFKNPTPWQARVAMLTPSEPDDSDESVLFREALRWQFTKGEAVQSEKIFQELTARKRLFTGEPFAASLLDSIEYVMYQARKAAPKFNTLDQRGKQKFGPEMQALRDELHRAFAEKGSLVKLAEPLGVNPLWTLSHELPVFFRPPAARKPDVGLPEEPGPARTPTFADSPPLAVRRSWQPMQALPEDGVNFLLSKTTFFAGDC